MARRNNKNEPLPEWALDKMVGVLEGPLNTALERVMRSRLVTTPLSLSLALSLRVYTKVAGRHPHAARDAHAAPHTPSHGANR